MTLQKFNPLVATATELQHLLSVGSITSVDLVNVYLDQIAKYDKSGPKLNAIISTPPRDGLLEIASSLDNERATGIVRGPLHGIPIILKVRLMMVSNFSF
jgi:amidase